jgi:hypothetical protein
VKTDRKRLSPRETERRRKWLADRVREAFRYARRDVERDDARECALYVLGWLISEAGITLQESEEFNRPLEQEKAQRQSLAQRVYEAGKKLTGGES